MATVFGNETGGLVGLRETAGMLGLGRAATVRRSQRADFPSPVARLACGPVWRADDIAGYARARCRRFEERPGVQALARSGCSGVLTVPEAAGTLGVPAARVRAVLEADPSLAAYGLGGELVGARRDRLAQLARALSPGRVETR